MRRTLITLLPILLGLSLVVLCAAPATAGSCDADCEGENCTGDCEIDSISCSTGCSSDNCPGHAICREYGESESGHSCVYEMSSKCEVDGSALPIGGPEQPPGPFRVEPSAEWSVISYRTDRVSPLAWGDVAVLATSNPTWARGSLDTLVSNNHEETARLRQRIRAGELRYEPRPPQERFHFAVSPGSHCIGVRLEVAERHVGGAADAALLVRATVDGRGRIVAARPLHSLGDADAASMVRFLKANTTLWREDGVESPFEVFVVFSTRTDGSAGWMVSGAEPLL